MKRLFLFLHNKATLNKKNPTTQEHVLFLGGVNKVLKKFLPHNTCLIDVAIQSFACKANCKLYSLYVFKVGDGQDAASTNWFCSGRGSQHGSFSLGACLAWHPLTRRSDP